MGWLDFPELFGSNPPARALAPSLRGQIHKLDKARNRILLDCSLCTGTLLAPAYLPPRQFEYATQYVAGHMQTMLRRNMLAKLFRIAKHYYINVRNTDRTLRRMKDSMGPGPGTGSGDAL